MYITRIKVRNFRSLTETEVYPANYTVLVGQNDSGKSNLLRALNLFFNNQTDVGEPLSFEQDYSQQAPIRKGKAKQIEIELELKPPPNYTDNAPVVWKKTWRAGSSVPHSDELKPVGGGEFSPRSRTENWVRQLGFEYVPAIRGKDFFATLKRRLHNTLAATIAPKLASASGSFLGNIRKEIGNIETEARRLFDLKTEFSLPADLGSLFEILDLKTADKHAATSLQYRGDGIQGRHIPVILRFLADQRKINSAQGKAPPETIWGYEEPENNLELGKQVEEAEEFFRCSESIQVLLTTHSPAFYGAAKNQTPEKAAIWFAQRKDGKTEFDRALTQDTLDQGMGLMPFVQPYLKRAAEQRAQMVGELKTLHAQSLHPNAAVLVVEGSTDKEVLDAASELLFGSSKAFEIVAKPGLGAGVGWVLGYATARAVMPDIQRRTGVLFDGDAAGRESQRNLSTRLKALDRTDRVKGFRVGHPNSPSALRKVLQSGFNIGIALEEVCSEDAWDHAESRGWLVTREDAVSLNATLLSTEESFVELLDRHLDDSCSKRLVLKKLDPLKKSAFARFVTNQIREQRAVPPNLEVLLNGVQTYFSRPMSE